MADLSQLLGPGTAALWAGQNQKLEQEKAMADADRVRAEIEAARQKMAFDQHENPLLLENKRLTNEGLSAGLPGILADSQSKVLGVDKAKKTQETDISKINAENLFKGNEAKAKRTKMFGDLFVQFSPLISQIPDAPGARLTAMQQLMRQAGFPEDSPETSAYGQILSAVPSSQLPSVLKAIGEGMVKMSSPYIQATDVAKIGADARLEAKEKEVEARVKIEADKLKAKLGQASEKSKTTAKSLIEQVQAGKLTFEKAATAFEVMAAMEDDAEAKQKYSGLARAFEEANLKAKNATAAGKPDLAGTGIPVQEIKPSLGGGAKPPQGTKENPIVLK